MASAAPALTRPGVWRLDPARRLQLGTLLGLWILWEVLGHSGLVYPGVLPSWVRIGAALVNFVVTPGFWFHLAVTLGEVLLSLSIGTGLGLLVGVPLGADQWLGPVLERYVNTLAATPKVVFLPLFFLIFGIGSEAKVAVGAFACSFPVALGIANAMRNIPSVLVRVGRTYQLTPWQMTRMIYLPALSRPLATALQIALGIAVSACLIAEMRFATRGLGYLVIASYEQSRFAEVYAVLATIIIMASLLNSGLAYATKDRRRRDGPLDGLKAIRKSD